MPVWPASSGWNLNKNNLRYGKGYGHRKEKEIYFEYYCDIDYWISKSPVKIYTFGYGLNLRYDLEGTIWYVARIK